jgi:hypothetical protein
MSELRELVDLSRRQIDHLHAVVRADLPLQIHARYTRIEILAALGEGHTARTPPWREGVYLAKSARADLLAFTLDKTSGDCPPTTRYRDYAISRELIHWASQSGTRAESSTGSRYRTHAAMGHSILLLPALEQTTVRSGSSAQRPT